MKSLPYIALSQAQINQARKECFHKRESGYKRKNRERQQYEIWCNGVIEFIGVGTKCIDYIIHHRNSECSTIDLISRLYAIADKDNRTMLGYKVKKVGSPSLIVTS